VAVADSAHVSWPPVIAKATLVSVMLSTVNVEGTTRSSSSSSSGWKRRAAAAGLLL
jgi:hypothetical protein